MLFICPHFDNMPATMLRLSRLYAYPVAPEPPPDDGLVILDSGAFGLSQRGLQIGAIHARRLATYYRSYFDRSRYRCIAPDVFLNPRQTMLNWQWWHDNIALPVVPVIQFPKKYRIDLYSALKQAQFYATWKPDFVAISNPGLQAIQSTGIVEICALVRQTIGGQLWLHHLGAGWSPQDLARWRDLCCFDSLDTIAYYTDAQDGWLWRRDGGRERCARTWREVAMENAQVAVEIATGG